MSEKETYKGHTIEVFDGSPPQLRIDDAAVDLAEDSPGLYITSNIPYMDYGSILDLAKAVIDDVPNVNCLSSK